MRAQGRSREIQEQIKKLIIDRRLPSGAPLPTETELMELLEVSRNSVREALKALQAMGIVEIRHGFGTYVGAMSMAPMTEGLSFRTVAGHYRGEDSLLQLLELREAVETGLMARLVTEGAGKAAGSRTGSGALEELVARMGEEARAGGVRAETDRAFHSALYGGLGNSLLSEVLDAFWDAFHRVRTDLAELPQDPMVTWRQHAEILAAVRAGDAGRAERAVRDHFGHIRERLRSATAEACANRPQFDDSSVTSVTAISPQPR
ncbi:FadR/GntR family transcriptional regulator [Streptomyces iconiensis]|uniref:FadR/GntR family transcriptional regulator n=1 Tax=Streptomyces iconiensis TaxID=1384038 RepID=A0ABT6ZW36_9ACTN|nr:FadR/GntR family transcriptional regulator [Streptomyces iconiensis]MDJ1133281.1 FadR/GntR family transcriptional regulator [Streptomyces iconiensis]